jgi:hypothetical protein
MNCINCGQPIQKATSPKDSRISSRLCDECAAQLSQKVANDNSLDNGKIRIGNSNRVIDCDQLSQPLVSWDPKNKKGVTAPEDKDTP